VTGRLDELLALIPASKLQKSKLFEAELEVRLKATSPQQIESEALDGVVEMLWVMCEFSFGRQASKRQTVAGLLGNDAFALVSLYIKQLAPAEPDHKACLDAIIDLLLRSAADPGRSRDEVKVELVTAYILATAWQNVHSGKRALDRVHGPALRDDLYRSLHKSATLSDILAAVRQRFMPRASI
jgi:hypothetical protein